MEKRTLITISLLAAVAAGAGAFGCSATEEEEAGGTNDQVVAGSAGAVLKSTLFLESGCTAVKVGPKHILVAARCVQGNAAIAPGKILGFTSAAAGMNTIAAPTTTTAADGGASDAGRADSGREAGAPADAGRADSGGSDSNASARGAKIAEVIVHPSFAAKCKDDTCGFNKLDASDAPDIAVITLEEELTSVPTVPVDLDAVGQSDPVLVVNSGCTDLEAKITTAAVASKTIAVPARAVNHEGSPYRASPQLSTRLASSYVVTPGAGWKSGEPRLCKSDIGAPLFRANAHAVAGITSNFTTYTASGKVQPVTMHHTRVDTASRFKIGSWLSDMGVETVHSCSETAGGCVKRNYDGGVPGETTTGTTEPGDGGTVIDPDGGDTDGGATTPAEEEPTGPRNEQLPEEEPEYASEEEADFGDAAVTKKKKKPAEGGCSAAPGQPAPTGGLAIGMMLALGAIVARRRK
ncbi:MAG: hypothetical protein JST00_34380 [Deltaproteobacteria bacterium]|nr:hypothetical protein [Deltaproteobacteria bacterium]